MNKKEYILEHLRERTDMYNLTINDIIHNFDYDIVEELALFYEEEDDDDFDYDEEEEEEEKDEDAPKDFLDVIDRDEDYLYEMYKSGLLDLYLYYDKDDIIGINDFYDSLCRKACEDGCVWDEDLSYEWTTYSPDCLFINDGELITEETLKKFNALYDRIYDAGVFQFGKLSEVLHIYNECEEVDDEYMAGLELYNVIEAGTIPFIYSCDGDLFVDVSKYKDSNEYYNYFDENYLSPALRSIRYTVGLSPLSIEDYMPVEEVPDPVLEDLISKGHTGLEKFLEKEIER